MGLIQHCFFFLVVFHVVLNEPRGAYGTRFGGSISSPALAPDTAPAPNMTPASAPAPETPLTAGGVCETMVTKAGYKCQEFKVTTKDGYILSLQRVNSGKGNPKTKEPAFLQHGLFMDGASWFLDSPKESLGFILADNNYDVWVGNTRGTRYSRGHTRLNSLLPQYWDYSWDDMALSDLPAYINFVYKQTKKKINYIGHSQGTIMALASFSLGPKAPDEVLTKLKAAALLSPVAYLSHMLNPMSRIVAKTIAQECQGAYAMAEVNMKDERMSAYLGAICKSVQGLNCFDSVSSFTGKNCCLNATSFDKFIANSPQSTSAKNSMHLAQTSNSGKFTKYDYGLLNMVKYGQLTPPPYPLTNIPKNLPIFISYGVNDALADPQDVEHLLSDMKHPKNKLEVQKIANYGHLDFIIATNANRIVFKPMIAFLKRQK
ncbi:triacylglycerol lipase 2-like [Papaver somniferum]|uniref:triacylglycerol lipase 2-like n=1 Tax=Papaver somniferum TaxID=3469 RepID=UPI000E6FA923|nr:triacylglycerol lipase 2-like [Papaver somniferum]